MAAASWGGGGGGRVVVVAARTHGDGGLAGAGLAREEDRAAGDLTLADHLKDLSVGLNEGAGDGQVEASGGGGGKRSANRRN